MNQRDEEGSCTDRDSPARKQLSVDEILARQDEFEDLFMTFWDRNPTRTL
ncbi:hypothetical protein [Rhodococcus sp. 14-2470-1a]|nr:hypothetical protein [Rhodococcus sp. 14-2470-1a]